MCLVLHMWDASSNLACITQADSRLLSTVLYIRDKNPIKKTDKHTSATKTQ